VVRRPCHRPSLSDRQQNPPPVHPQMPVDWSP
jgi:hypothetical protein